MGDFSPRKPASAEKSRDGYRAQRQKTSETLIYKAEEMQHVQS